MTEKPLDIPKGLYAQMEKASAGRVEFYDFSMGYAYYVRVFDAEGKGFMEYRINKSGKVELRKIPGGSIFMTPESAVEAIERKHGFSRDFIVAMINRVRGSNVDFLVSETNFMAHKTLMR